MNGFKPSPLGILKCRDLVTLYYGFPMVATLRENTDLLTTSFRELLPQDTRRIKYELVLTNFSATVAHAINIGSPQSVGPDNLAEYVIQPNTTITIERSFLSELDAVVISVQGNVDAGTDCEFSTREVLLTPAPVDEVPLP